MEINDFFLSFLSVGSAAAMLPVFLTKTLFLSPQLPRSTSDFFIIQNNLAFIQIKLLIYLCISKKKLMTSTQRNNQPLNHFF